MKKLGLVGGLGPVSTLDYYKQINEKYKEIVKPESVAGDNVLHPKSWIQDWRCSTHTLFNIFIQKLS